MYFCSSARNCLRSCHGVVCRRGSAGSCPGGAASGVTNGSFLCSSLSSPTNIPHIAICVTTVTMTSIARNQTIPRTLMSLCSCATSTFSRLPCGCAWASVPGVLPMSEHLLEVRIVDRHQRVATQLTGKEEQPHAGEPDRDRDVGQADRERAGGGRHGGNRRDQTREPYPDDEPRDTREQARTALQVAREQQEERQEKMADHDQQADVLPAVPHPHEIKRDLLRQVAGPDDQELREREV